MVRNRRTAGALCAALSAGLVSISVPALAAANDTMSCTNSYKPGAGYYAYCLLVTNPGSASQQIWKINGIQFATNTSRVTPGCSHNSTYTVTVTYQDGNGNPDSRSDTETCGAVNP